MAETLDSGSKSLLRVTVEALLGAICMPDYYTSYYMPIREGILKPVSIAQAALSA